MIRRIPIRYWPDAERPATYHGAREIEDAVAQTWRTDAGTVCVVWPLPERSGEPLLRQVAAQLPEADTLVRMQFDFGLDDRGCRPRNPATSPDGTTSERAGLIWPGYWDSRRRTGHVCCGSPSC